MKKIFLLVVLIATVFSIPALTQDIQKTSSLSVLVPAYYDIKNGLVNSDAGATAAKAGDFLSAVNNVDTKSLSTADSKAFLALKDKLAYDARHISESTDIAHQREHFANFSANFFKLAKSVKLTDQPVYYDYCPMKKSYWLSADAAIKNPYFGKQMPTCGRVTETLNKQ